MYAIIKQLNFLGDASDQTEKKKDQNAGKGLLSQPINLLKRFAPHMTPDDWDQFFDDLNKK